jgi:hypothetical protein
MVSVRTYPSLFLGAGAVAAVLCGAPGAARAGSEAAELAEASEEELESPVEELFLGSLPFMQDALELQLSAASTWARSREADVVEPLLVAELGITDRLQVEVEAPFAVVVPSEGSTGGGLGNTQLGVAYGFLRSAALGMSVAGGVSAVLPSSSTDEVESCYGGAAELGVYKVLGPVHASLSVEAGVEVPVEEGMGEREAVAEGALSFLAPLGAVTPIAEVAVEREGETELRSVAGLVWHPSEALELGLAGLMSRGEDETEWGAAINITWEADLAGDDRD